MKTFDVTVNGEVYPCTYCMGAHLDFLATRGYDLRKADLETTVDSMALLWALVKSTCRRFNKDFKLSLVEFADALDYAEFLDAIANVKELYAEIGEIAEKKTTKAKT